MEEHQDKETMLENQRRRMTFDSLCQAICSIYEAEDKGNGLAYQRAKIAFNCRIN